MNLENVRNDFIAVFNFKAEQLKSGVLAPTSHNLKVSQNHQPFAIRTKICISIMPDKECKLRKWRLQACTCQSLQASCRAIAKQEKPATTHMTIRQTFWRFVESSWREKVSRTDCYVICNQVPMQPDSRRNITCPATSEVTQSPQARASPWMSLKSGEDTFGEGFIRTVL